MCILLLIIGIVCILNVNLRCSLDIFFNVLLILLSDLARNYGMFFAFFTSFARLFSIETVFNCEFGCHNIDVLLRKIDTTASVLITTSSNTHLANASGLDWFVSCVVIFKIENKLRLLRAIHIKDKVLGL